MRLDRQGALDPVAALPPRPMFSTRGARGDRGPTPPADAEDLGMSELRITLDALTLAERRDLANALLRAAWGAALDEVRILLVDLVTEVDDMPLADVR